MDGDGSYLHGTDERQSLLDGSWSLFEECSTSRGKTAHISIDQ